MKPPVAEPGLTCPLWRKDISKVCHNCAWYGHLEGQHPQTGERINMWQCALTRMVLTTLETAKCANETVAATQHVRNDMREERVSQARLLMVRSLTDDRSNQKILPAPEAVED